MTGIVQTLIGGFGAVAAAVTDAYFNLVTLLLPGNGTNGAQNNTFLDSSTNNFTITRNGNTTQGTFSPFSQTGWSNYFDGSSAYLTLADNVAFEPGTGDFTIEAWVYDTVAAGTLNVYIAHSSGGVSLYRNASGKLEFAQDSVAAIATSTNNIPVNSWNHVAVSRSGTSLKLFINGAQEASVTNSTNLAGTGSLGIGASSNGSNKTTGYISNLRLVKGTAVYTAAFTPPTSALTAIANTQLLTCQSNRFIDNSSNAFAITVNGSPSVQAFSPFAPTAAYSAATNGGSGYFDGSGDYLTTGTASALNFGTGNFTIEAWYYLTSTTNLDATMIADGGASYTSTSKIFKLYWFGQNFPALDFGSGNGSVTANNTAARLNQWNHVALVRSGNTFTMYLNGVAGTPVTFTGSVNFNSNNNTFIGFSNYNTPTNGYFTGYIAGLRATNTAVYSANFTPPTAPPTAITNTQLLLNFTNAGITDATAKNDLETVGNAQISTTQSKFGGSSMYFDGNGDYLIDNSQVNPIGFGTGDFTIEFWLYLNSTGTQVIFDGRRTAASDVAPMIYYLTGLKYYTNGADRISGGTLSTGQWYHIALSRSGTSTKMFIDGTQTGSTYTDSNNYVQQSQRPLIGAEGVTVGNSPLNAYIDDLRITKGLARYTGNFTAPTAAFALQ